MKRPAVFIDRDGTMNEQMGYINHPSRFRILPGTAEAIGHLNRHGILAIVISNQSGVARGYFPFELVQEVNALMERRLAEEGARIDAIFFCPHHPRGVVPEFTMACDCRKPGIGLLTRACRSLDIDMTRSYMIGDRYLDIQTAERAGIKGILVKTGYGIGDMEHILPGKTLQPAHIAEDLLHAVRWLLEREKALAQE